MPRPRNRDHRDVIADHAVESAQKWPSECQCEDSRHLDAEGNDVAHNEKPTLKILTNFGTFYVCADCATHMGPSDTLERL